jgi:hypothetical protein
VLFAFVSFALTVVALRPAPGAPSLELGYDDRRPAPVLIDVAAAPVAAARELGSPFHLPRKVDVSVASLMKSLGAATTYRVAPGVGLGAGSSVAVVELPAGHLRALQLFTVLRIKF